MILNDALDEKQKEAIMELERESRTRVFTGIPGYIMNGLLLLFAAYVVWTTLLVILPLQVRRSAFVGILVFIGYLYYPARKGMTKRVNYIPWYDIVLAVLGAGAFFYHAIAFQTIVRLGAIIRPQDVYVGVVGIILLGEICRRVVGLPILVVAAGFITFAFYQGFFFFGDPLYNVVRLIVFHLFYTTEGIIGIPVGVASTFIVLFIFLASFLEKTGIAKFFIDLANSVAGASSGGPAKVAVIASALLGMISGSSVANTVSSGSVTIPAMKKTGYKPEFAAAVEASSSTGGQLVPPILGAAAFIMAEITGIPFLTIATAAIIPAFLYFVGVFIMVHLEAKKTGLKGLPKETIPKFGPLILRNGYLFLPVVVLVFLMSRGYSPSFAATWGIFAVFVVSFFRKDTRFTPTKFIQAVATGTRNTLGVGIACAIAGTVIGVVTLTGIGNMLIGMVSSVVTNPFLISINASLFVALLITALACLILGMGVPTTAKYVIMATITAPMILSAGAGIGIEVPLLAAHMFVFYFGTDADITPPVGLAAYAGAAIAKSDPLKTSIIATKLAIAAYIVPFIFVFSPEMLFQVWSNDAQSYVLGADPLLMIKIIISAVVGMFNISVGLQGYLLRKVSWPFRLIAIGAGILLINPAILTTLIGLGISAVVIVIHTLQYKIGKRREVIVQTVE